MRAWLAPSWPQGACGSVVGLTHPAAVLVQQTQHKIEMDARDKSPGAIPPPMPGMVRLAAVVALKRRGACSVFHVGRMRCSSVGQGPSSA